MRIIFLDIDGVLNKALVASNSEESDVLKVLPYGWMNKSLVENLNKITDETKAKIVVSSAWRHSELEKNKKMLKSFGVKAEVLGSTPHLGRYSVRGNEIKAWLDDNKEILGGCSFKFKQYVIIDDSSDMLLEQAEHFIHTDAYAGLSNHAAHKVKLKLNSLTNLM